MLTLRVLILSSELLAKVAKTDPLVTPVGDNAYITFGDLQSIQWKLNTAFVAIVAWFLMQAWDSYKRSKDDTKERLERMEKMLERLDARMEHTPTFKDLHGKER